MQVLIFSQEKASLSHFHIYPSFPYTPFSVYFSFALFPMNTATAAVDLLCVWEKHSKREREAHARSYLLSIVFFPFPLRPPPYIHTLVYTLVLFLLTFLLVRITCNIFSFPCINHTNSVFPY